MKPVCVKCQRFFRPKKNGVYFIEGMPVINEPAIAGTSHPEHWKPYKLWAGDEWECIGCGATIISGVGFNPVSEHYKPEFGRLKEQLNATLQVNDC